MLGDFLSMADNYEERKVDNYTDETSGLSVDTCAVNDSDQPFETGIQHPKYNNGKWVIVELYPDKESAQKGHDKWVKIMTAPKLPRILENVSTAVVKRLGEAIFGDECFDNINELETDN